MADDTIFLATDGTLSALIETPYETEAVLQQALTRFPDVLAGVATDATGKALLLVSQEMSVPAGPGLTGLSLDHLFLDADGVPVLVEVKRSTDTRIRREVVAQMLDYAANAVVYWPMERLRSLVEDASARAAEEDAIGGDSPIDPLAPLGSPDPDQYWRLVDQNLRSGRVRLIFLADRLPPELVRIIEFLNEQMRDVEVLGVELPQYKGTINGTVYVPRVVGQTSAAVDAKRGGSERPSWTPETLLAYARDRGDDAPVSNLLERLFAHVSSRSGRFSAGTGSTPGLTGWYRVDGKDTPVWNVNLGVNARKASIYFIFRDYVSRHPERIERYGTAVACIPNYGPVINAARDRHWRTWSPLPLSVVASSAQVAEKLFAALDIAVTPTTSGEDSLGAQG